jgi:hypothetical protein
VVLVLVRFLAGEADIIFELPDQKVQNFLVSMAFKQWFLKYVRKVFGEMHVRI